MTSQEESQLDEVWDDYYQDSKSNYLIRFITDRYFNKIFHKDLLSILGEKEVVILEPGCGEAEVSVRLCENKKNYVILLDKSKKALEQAKKKGEGSLNKPSYIRGDIFRLPFKKNCVDVCWNQGVIEHFKGPVSALKEMYQVTKPVGKLVIYVPARYSLLHSLYVMLRKTGLFHLWPFGEQVFYSKKRLYDQIANASGELPTVRRIPFNFWLSWVGFIDKKPYEKDGG